MRKREKRNIAILLSVAMLFSMNYSTAAQELEDDAVVQEVSGEYDTAVDVIGLSDAGDDMIQTVSERSSRTVELEGGWSCEIVSDDSADVTFSEGKCLITPKNEKIISMTEGESTTTTTYYCGDKTQLFFNGSIDSKDIIIETRDRCLYYDPEKLSTNSITFNISGDEAAASGYHQLKIYVQSLGIPDEKTKSVVSGIGLDCKFNLSPGLTMKYWTRDTDIMGDSEVVELDGISYSVYTIYSCIDNNYPFNFVNKKIGDYTVGYYSNIPFFGKKIKKGYVDDVLGEIVVQDKDGNVFEVEKVKVVRMKNPPAGQGAYPTVSNAGLQITKLEYDHTVSSNYEGKDQLPEKAAKKLEKEVTKALKKATKVNKKASADTYQLPLVIYPFRLSKAAVTQWKGNLAPTYASLKLNKKGNKVTLNNFCGNKKYTIKDGKKDSFKNGRHSVKYVEPYLTVSSADVWTGPVGLSWNGYNF